MDDFVRNAESLNLRRIIAKATLQGMFFAVSMSWDRAISATVSLFFDEPESVAARFAQAFALTAVISIGICSIAHIFKEEPDRGQATVVARIGTSRTPQRRN
jgi:hypothetical protein